MISVYGNCQAKQIFLMLTESKNFVNKYGNQAYIALNYIYEKEHMPIEQIIENFQKSKLLIYQPLSEKHKDYSTKHLLKFLPENCERVSFPYIFNDALWGYNVSGNHKDAINGEFELSQSNKIKERFCDNIKILQEKEKETDIKVSDFIIENIQKKELFHTQNHLSPYFFKQICIRILYILNLENDIENLDDRTYATYYPEYKYGYTEDAKRIFNFEFLK
jgi:hypothetical protein